MKVLANRLGSVLDGLIDPAHSGFIKRCNILDSVAAAHEVIIRSKTSREEGFLRATMYRGNV